MAISVISVKARSKKSVKELISLKENAQRKTRVVSKVNIPNSIKLRKSATAKNSTANLLFLDENVRKMFIDGKHYASVKVVKDGNNDKLAIVLTTPEYMKTQMETRGKSLVDKNGETSIATSYGQVVRTNGKLNATSLVDCFIDLYPVTLAQIEAGVIFSTKEETITIKDYSGEPKVNGRFPKKDWTFQAIVIDASSNLVVNDEDDDETDGSVTNANEDLE